MVEVVQAVGVTRVNEPLTSVQTALLGYEWAGLQAYPELVADAEGETRVKEPAVEMQETPPGYEWAGLQANEVTAEEVVFMGQAAAKVPKKERTEAALMEFILSEWMK